VAGAGAAAFLVLSLAASPAAARDTQKARWLKIRVYQDGAGTPSVLVNLPMSLVSAVLRMTAKAETRADTDLPGAGGDGPGPRHKDLDLGALIRELEAMEPGQIVEVQDGDEKVSIWIE
jgi:hypothetical protein